MSVSMRSISSRMPSLRRPRKHSPARLSIVSIAALPRCDSTSVLKRLTRCGNCSIRSK